MSTSHSDQPSEFVILIVGNTGVGKSTIVYRYLENKFISVQPTMGIQRKPALIDLPDKKQQAIIIDTSGQQQYLSQVRMEYKQAKAVVMVFDITDKQSFHDIQTWYSEIHHANIKIPYWILVGNKSDLKDKRQISTEDGKKLAQQCGAKYIESSPVMPANINMIFITIQQWTMIPIDPRTVSEQTQKLLQKNENEELHKSLITNKVTKKLKGHNVSQSFEEPQQSVNNDQMHDYFNNMMQKVDGQSSQLADQLVKSSAQKIISKLADQVIKVNQQQYPVYGDHQHKDDNQMSMILLEKQHKQLDKLRRELDQNLYQVQQQSKLLRADQINEIQQSGKLEKYLAKRLSSVEQSMLLIKTDLLLNKKTHHFSSNQQKFQNLNESITLKLQMSEINNPEHLKEVSDIIKKTVSERKALETKRLQRFEKYQEQLKLEEIARIDDKVKNQMDAQQKKKEQILGRLSSMEKIQKDRDQAMKQQNLQVQQLIKVQNEHKKQEQIQQENTINEELKYQKDKLQQLKQLYKPIRLEEIKEWDEEYEKKKQIKEQLRHQKMIEINKVHYKPSYESKQYQEAKLEVMNRQKEKDDEAKAFRQKLQASQEFQLKLREFVPIVSEYKQQELEKLKGRAHHTVNYQEYIDMSKRVKSKGMYFDTNGNITAQQIDEEHFNKLKQMERTDEIDPKELGNQYLVQVNRRIKKSVSQQGHNVNSQLTDSQFSPLRNAKQSQFNEIKQQWKLKPQQQLNEVRLQKILNEQIVLDKSNTMVSEVNILANRAIRKMELLSAQGYQTDNMTQMGDAEMMLVNTIKAKLQFIDMDPSFEKTVHKRSQFQRRSQSIDKLAII